MHNLEPVKMQWAYYNHDQSSFTLAPENLLDIIIA